MDESFIEEWLESPQTSLYYSLQVMGDTRNLTRGRPEEQLRIILHHLLEIMNLHCDAE